MKKRILFVINSLMMGGAQRVALHMIEHWLSLGCDVTLLVTFYRRGGSDFRIPDGVNLVYLADLAPPGRSRMVDQLRRIKAMRQFLRQHAPDFILSFMTDANIAVLLASVGLGLKIVVSERSYPPKDVLPWNYRAMRRLLYPRAQAVVMQTRKGASWLMDAIPSANGAVVFNPVVIPLAEQSPCVDPASLILPGDRVILGVGRLVRLKQFDKLISAFAIIAGRIPAWRLVIAGGGSEAGALRQKADDLGLGTRVVFPGHVGNPGAWYTQAEIFVLTSQYEGFPNSLLEAMAHGCAPVALDCETGPSEMIVDGENGRLLPLDATESDIAEVLLELIENDLVRQSIASNARDVSLRYSLPSIMASWDKILFRGN